MGVRRVMDPVWNGTGFEGQLAGEIWSLFPELLRRMAVEEFLLGNVAGVIQEDLNTGVVLLGFKQPPCVVLPEQADITVHTTYAFGNYRYDDTVCTYEYGEREAFLSFRDPTYDHDAVTGMNDAP